MVMAAAAPYVARLRAMNLRRPIRYWPVSMAYNLRARALFDRQLSDSRHVFCMTSWGYVGSTEVLRIGRRGKSSRIHL